MALSLLPQRTVQDSASRPGFTTTVRQALAAVAGRARRFGGWAVPRLDPVALVRQFSFTAVIDLALIVGANYYAFWLRFDGDIPPECAAAFLQTIPWLLTVRGVVFASFGLFGGLWRYTGIWDLSRLLLAVGTSSGLLYLVQYQPLGPALIPRSVVIIDSMVVVCLLGGMRLLWRILPSAVRPEAGRRVLIIGAGDAGDMIVREMQKGGQYQPIGFIDDDPAKLGRTMHGVEVLGARTDLSRVVAEMHPSEALVAIPSATPAFIRSCVQILEGFKVPITTLPSLAELVNGKVGLKQIRPVRIEDLLPRSEVALTTEDGRRLVQGKSILVTGAGGSIGSELCRQIAMLEPAELILYERYENSLYAIANDLADRGMNVPVQTVVGDVTDTARLESVFETFRPQLVFHAAAHKHVPLMELNPCEAVKNNVGGTRSVARAAARYGVERFVLVSTDKAANPSSVMGASKRVAELIVQAVAAEVGTTRFVTVRFGNVLGSNGSVIPRMIDQIRAGGPVTVTHPEIRRYFMSIPEAVQLVLKAGVLARERETFVLDMGEQIKVLDVARNLIRLSGFVPDEEIPIKFIGLRPGEKLSEELIGDGEALEPSGIDKVFRVRRAQIVDLSALTQQVQHLIETASRGEPDKTLQALSRIMPGFRPWSGERSIRVATVPRKVALQTLPGSVSGAIGNAVPVGLQLVPQQSAEAAAVAASRFVTGTARTADAGMAASVQDFGINRTSPGTRRRRTLSERMLLLMGWKLESQESVRD